MPTPSATHVPRAPRQSSACSRTSTIAVVSIALVAPPPVWSRTASTTSSTSGSMDVVAPSSAASCRRRSTGSTTTIVGDPERSRRHHRREAHAAGAEHDERRALVELEHVHDRAGARLHAAAERRGHAEVDVSAHRRPRCPRTRAHGSRSSTARRTTRRPGRPSALSVVDPSARTPLALSAGTVRSSTAGRRRTRDMRDSSGSSCTTASPGRTRSTPCADLLDDSGALVPEHDGIAPRSRRAAARTPHAQIRVTDPARDEPDQNLVARGSSSSTVLEREGAARAMRDSGFDDHGREPYDRARLPLRGRRLGRAQRR